MSTLLRKLQSSFVRFRSTHEGIECSAPDCSHSSPFQPLKDLCYRLCGFKSETAEAGENAEKPCPLSCVRVKDALRVVGVRAAGACTKRLSDLGLVRDAKIRVASTSGSSFIVVLSESSRLALGPEMAEAVWVERA